MTAHLALALRAGVRGLPLLRTGYARALGLSVPPPLGGVDVDHSGPLKALDIDWDVSFRSVLALIKNFHSMEAPAGIPSARCRASLASIYGFMSETSPTFHLPLSPLLRSLLDRVVVGYQVWVRVQVPARRYRYGYQAGLKYGYGYWYLSTGTGMGTMEWVWVQLRVPSHVETRVRVWVPQWVLGYGYSYQF